ncbi:MAG: CotH kinase family protein, partial [Planctomycetales bacterium]|nr:CotH kinase family protein [Planctomycetales bacterium]
MRSANRRVRKDHFFTVEKLEDRNLLAVSITEFLTSNNGEFVDEDGEQSDWIELYNSGPESADIEGWYLTDDAGELTKWTFPNQSLEADSYLVVFASDKDRAVAGSELHTNFKLKRSGEYLALVKPDGTSVASDFKSVEGGYPEQLGDVSYGPTVSVESGQIGNFYMPEPTPGMANNPGMLGFIGDTSFSVDRGFYSAADLQPDGKLANGVVISTGEHAPDSTVIYYTTDGSVPAADNPNATLYSVPVAITTTTTLRAAAFASNYIPTNVDTHTYIFTAAVLQQDGEGLPPLTQTDYVMDPEIVNDPRFSTLEDDLKSLPTVSFVGSVGDKFGPSGIIENPLQFGRDWEREVSVELINPDGSDGFQENAGLRIQGAGSRARPFSKKGFQLFFRDEYGASKLNFPYFGESRSDEIDRIAFRGNFFDSWTFDSRGRIGGACCGYDQALLLRDQFGHTTQADMGSLAIAGNWVHLYINGQYWGLYNSVERPDEDFAAYYLGGDADNYDVMKQRPRGTANGSLPEVVNGGRTAWNELMTLIRGDMESDEVYEQVKATVDLEQFADYILLNVFGGNFDWPHNNWYAIRERTDDAKWTFYSWDTENFLFETVADRTEFNTDNSPGIIYSRLRRNEEFRLLFADRIHKHMFNDGVLTPQKNIERFDSIVNEIADGMNAESARWGDTHANAPRNTFDTWIPVVEEKRNNYFPQRTSIVLQQLLDDGLYTEVDAPEFYVNGIAQHGGQIASDTRIRLVQPSTAFVDTTLVAEGATIEAYIPKADEFATPVWTELSFSPTSDPQWNTAPITGTTGIGYDADGVYDPWIQTNVAAMEDNSGSLLTRITFTHDDTTTFDRLQLRIRYDDAFVAYLNGVEVARTSNVRTQAPPQAARARNHAATEEFEIFDISAFEDLLVDGANMLAIQGINVSRGSSDFLLVPMLVGGTLDLTTVNDNIWFTTDGSDPRDTTTNSPIGTATQFTDGFLLPESGQVKARVFTGGKWSALSSATFEATPSADVNMDGLVDAVDIDFVADAIRRNQSEPDLDGDG